MVEACPCDAVISWTSTARIALGVRADRKDRAILRSVAHLHAVLASRSPSAILLKRGPGKATGSFGWNRRTDSFTTGQWVRKIIDHTATDLSPDGKHFLYFVNTGGWLLENHVYRAIARAPWLKALAFWGSSPREFGPGAGLFFCDARGALRLRAGPARPEWDHLGLEVVPEFPSTRP
jgi:hypothetical protein